MAAKLNEAPILKATSVDLGDGDVGILLYVHHTPLKENKGKDPSWYRYEGVVMKKDQLQKLVQDSMADAVRLQPWRWLSKDPFWKDLYMSYDGGTDNGKFAAWLNCRIKKILPWDQYIDLVKNGNKRKSNGQIVHSDSAGYDWQEAYVRDDGQKVDVTDQAQLKASLGHTFCHACVMKRQLPKNPTTV
jgi:hypothetical protein